MGVHTGPKRGGKDVACIRGRGNLGMRDEGRVDTVDGRNPAPVDR